MVGLKLGAGSTAIICEINLNSRDGGIKTPMCIMIGIED